MGRLCRFLRYRSLCADFSDRDVCRSLFCNVLNRCCLCWRFLNRRLVSRNLFSRCVFSNNLSHLRLGHTERRDDHGFSCFDRFAIWITDQRQDARLIGGVNREESRKSTISARFNPFNHFSIKAQFHRATTRKLPRNHGCSVRFDPNGIKNRRSARDLNGRRRLCRRCRFRRCFSGHCSRRFSQISRCCGFRYIGALPNEISPKRNCSYYNHTPENQCPLTRFCRHSCSFPSSKLPPLLIKGCWTIATTLCRVKAIYWLFWGPR